MKLLLLYGGQSTEHEISCRSAANVLKVLKDLDYDLHVAAIDKEGVWKAQNKNTLLDKDPVYLSVNEEDTSVVETSNLLDDIINLKKKRPNSLDDLVVITTLHGTNGEDGAIQGLFQLRQIAFVGPDLLGSSVAMDKIVAKKLVETVGVPVVPYKDFYKYDGVPSYKEVSHLGLPLFVKPASLGSSVGIAKIDKEEDFEGAMKEAFSYDEKVLVETGVNAREIELAVLCGDKMEISGAGEIVTDSGFYSYDSKYNDEKDAAITVPAPISDEQAALLKDYTAKAFSALCLFGLSRVDFFLCKDSSNIYFNEANTLPGFTNISQYPVLWQKSGLDIKPLLEKLIATARLRFERQQNIKRSL